MSSLGGANTRQGWIWSQRADLLAFTLPAFLGLMIAILLFWSLPLTATERVLVYVLFQLSLDKVHVYATFFRVYLDPSFYQKRAAIFLGLPLIICCGTFTLVQMDKNFFWMAFAYLNAFHVIRQQNGFVSITNRKSGQSTIVARTIDHIAFYGIGICAILFSVSTSVSGEWIKFWTGASISVPLYFTVVAKVGFLIIVSAYSLYQAYIYANDTVRFNFAKFNFWIISICLFGSFFLFPKNYMMIAVVISFVHSLPYTILVYKEGARRWSKTEGFRKKIFLTKRGLAIYFFALAFISWLEYGVWKGFLKKDDYVSWLHIPIQANFSDLQINLLIAVFATPSLMHFIFDGLIWKSPSIESLKV